MCNDLLSRLNEMKRSLNELGQKEELEIEKRKNQNVCEGDR